MGSNLLQCLCQHIKCNIFHSSLPFRKKVVCCAVRHGTGYSYANKRNVASEFLEDTLGSVGCNKPTNFHGTVQRHIQCLYFSLGVETQQWKFVRPFFRETKLAYVKIGFTFYPLNIGCNGYPGNWKSSSHSRCCSNSLDALFKNFNLLL